jgi:hypothetical protein
MGRLEPLELASICVRVPFSHRCLERLERSVAIERLERLELAAV